MPLFVVDKVQNALNDHSKPVKRLQDPYSGSGLQEEILMMYVNLRRSISFSFWSGAAPKSPTAIPHVPHIRFDGVEICSDEGAMAKADCVVIVTDHSAIRLPGDAG